MASFPIKPEELDEMEEKINSVARKLKAIMEGESLSDESDREKVVSNSSLRKQSKQTTNKSSSQISSNRPTAPISLPKKIQTGGVIDYSKWEDLQSDNEEDFNEKKCSTAQQIKTLKNHMDPELGHDPRNKDSLSFLFTSFKGSLSAVKKAGKYFYCKGLFSEAIDSYTQPIESYYILKHHNSNKNQEFETLLYSSQEYFTLFNFLTILSNRALCFIKTENLNSALEDCFLAIAIQPMYGMAYWRRCEVYRLRNDFSLAWEDIQTTLRLLDNDKATKWVENLDQTYIRKVAIVLGKENEEFGKILCMEKKVFSSKQAFHNESTYQSILETFSNLKPEMDPFCWDTLKKQSDSLTKWMQVFPEDAEIIVSQKVLDPFLENCLQLIPSLPSVAEDSNLNEQFTWSPITTSISFIATLCKGSSLARKKLSHADFFPLLPLLVQNVLSRNDIPNDTVQAILELLLYCCDHDLVCSKLLTVGTKVFGNVLMQKQHCIQLQIMELTKNPYVNKKAIPPLLSINCLIIRVLDVLIQFSPSKLHSSLGLRVIDLENVVYEFWTFLEDWYDSFSQPTIMASYTKVMNMDKEIDNLLSTVSSFVFHLSCCDWKLDLGLNQNKEVYFHAEERHQCLITLSGRILASFLKEYLMAYSCPEAPEANSIQFLKVEFLVAYYNLVSKATKFKPEKNVIQELLVFVNYLPSPKQMENSFQVESFETRIHYCVLILSQLISRESWIVEEVSKLISKQYLQHSSIPSGIVLRLENALTALKWKQDFGEREERDLQEKKSWIHILATCYHAQFIVATETCFNMWQMWLQREGVNVLKKLLDWLISVLHFLEKETHASTSMKQTVQKAVGDLGYLLCDIAKQEQFHSNLEKVQMVDTVVSILQDPKLSLTDIRKNYAVVCARLTSSPAMKERLRELNGIQLLYQLGPDLKL